MEDECKIRDWFGLNQCLTHLGANSGSHFRWRGNLLVVRLDRAKDEEVLDVGFSDLADLLDICARTGVESRRSIPVCRALAPHSDNHLINTRYTSSKSLSQQPLLLNCKAWQIRRQT